MRKSNPFSTWYEQKGPSNDFVAHYTKLDSYWQILHYENLRLSRLNNLNDTVEPALKIAFESKLNEDEVKNIKEYLRGLTAHISILSLSHDANEVERRDYNSDRFFNDFTGRSFALPRMWAHYGNNNQGICLIFNKQKLLKEVKNSSQFLFEDNIRYVLDYPCFKIDDILAKKILKNIQLHKGPSGTDYAGNKQFLSEHEEYISCNYMTKLKDWESEAEYRIIEWNNMKQPTINNLFNYLCGIVLGEHIDPACMSLIERNTLKKIPIYKIYFQANGIYLKPIERSN